MCIVGTTTCRVLSGSPLLSACCCQSASQIPYQFSILLNIGTMLASSRVPYCRHGCIMWAYVAFIFVSRVTGGPEPEADLEIVTEHTPDDCWVSAEIGDEVTVHYTGTLDNGKVFDSSRQSSRGPLPFKLGDGHVIPGWEQGIKGMCVGEKRRLVIPPHLAYGKSGHPPMIPADAALTFETELMSLKKRAVEEVFVRIIRFLALPVAVIVSIYYLYDKYKKTPNKKDFKNDKGDRRGKKKKH